MSEHDSEKAENIVRESIEENARLEMPLYSGGKGKNSAPPARLAGNEGRKEPLWRPSTYLFFFGIFIGLIPCILFIPESSAAF